ncbi:hypothetical protein ACHAWU_005062 [Discostella pseudostelligera]|uniref:Uncharacterized protein n=1 Tax=Discostella pseudostelligera TaxID=259834 RepID=A0ABD3M867_9STRA
MCQGAKFPGKNGSFTLSAALFQETWPGNSTDNASPDHNSMHPLKGCTDSHYELFPLHSPLLGESFPPDTKPQTNEFQQSWTQKDLHCHIPAHGKHFHMQQWLSGVQEHSDKHALGNNPKAQCAFKILMIHEVLQFALRIAFRCVLHRCGIQDIHC